MIFLHAAENPVEEGNRTMRIGSLIEHHTFGFESVGCVCDLRAGGKAFFGKAFQDLCGPNHGYVGRVTDSKDLLLDTADFVPAYLNGKITPGNHYANRVDAHRGQQDGWKIIEGLLGFNFYGDSQGGPCIEIFQERYKLKMK